MSTAGPSTGTQRLAVPECPSCGLPLHLDTFTPSPANRAVALRLHLTFGCDLMVTS